MPVDSTFLSPAELAAMIADVNATLPDTAQISRRTLTPDGVGGRVQAWGTIATVPCRVLAVPMTAAAGGTENVVESILTAHTAWIVTLPAGTDVTAKDRILTSGRTLEVNMALTQGSYNVSTRVICTELFV